DSNSDPMNIIDRDSPTLSFPTHPDRVHADDPCGRVDSPEGLSGRESRGVTGPYETTTLDDPSSLQGASTLGAGPPQSGTAEVGLNFKDQKLVLGDHSERATGDITDGAC